MSQPNPFANEVEEAARALQLARLEARQRAPARGAPFPSRMAVVSAATKLSAALYPRRLGGVIGTVEEEDDYVARKLGEALLLLRDAIADELAYGQAESGAPIEDGRAATIVRRFALSLGEIRGLIDTDLEAAFSSDPAARSIDEVLVCYPGASAIMHHRMAHALFRHGAPIVARMISEYANEKTGIDIHPGAAIGPSFFIDHGTGVVVGETAIIGARVKIYQHVTLGAPSPFGAVGGSMRRRGPRHPIVEDDVVIYAGATILGRVTIGRGSEIGGNVWLLRDVPEGSVVLQPGADVIAEDIASRMREALA